MFVREEALLGRVSSLGVEVRRLKLFREALLLVLFAVEEFRVTGAWVGAGELLTLAQELLK